MNKAQNREATTSGPGQAPSGAEGGARKGIGVLVSLAIAGLALCAIAGRGGRMDWRLDLLSHFHVQYLGIGAALTLLSALLRRPKSALLGLALSTYLGSQVAPLLIGGEPKPSGASTPLRVVALNVKTSNRSFERAASWLLETKPDVAVIQEVDEAWMAALEPSLMGLRRLPTDTARDDNFGMAIFVRADLETGDPIVHRTESDLPWIEVLTRSEAGPIRVIGVHTLPPVTAFCHGSRVRQLREVTRIAEASAEPVVVAGDLNSTIWSAPLVDALAGSRLRPACLGQGLCGSWHAALWFTGGILIDHALVDERLALVGYSLGPDVGSDHLGITVEVAR